jgi:hypothetical protein
MILPTALAIGAALVTQAAGSEQVPRLNVEEVCTGIAKQGGVTFRDPAIAEEKKNCIESELAIRQQLIKQWGSFSAADKTHCVNESIMGGQSSYTELITCLEMARDVREMRREQEGAENGQRGSTGTKQRN